jgi:hypothetical protein
MKAYRVIWEESFSVNVKAKNEIQAVELVMEGAFNPEDKNSEISSSPIAMELDR